MGSGVRKITGEMPGQQLIQLELEVDPDPRVVGATRDGHLMAVSVMLQPGQYESRGKRPGKKAVLLPWPLFTVSPPVPIIVATDPARRPPELTQTINCALGASYLVVNFTRDKTPWQPELPRNWQTHVWLVPKQLQLFIERQPNTLAAVEAMWRLVPYQVAYPPAVGWLGVSARSSMSGFLATATTAAWNAISGSGMHRTLDSGSAPSCAVHTLAVLLKMAGDK